MSDQFDPFALAVKVVIIGIYMWFVLLVIRVLTHIGIMSDEKGGK